MVKHNQTIRLQKPTNCLSVFDHYVGLALKGKSSPGTSLLKKEAKIFFWILKCQQSLRIWRLKG